MDLSEIKLPSNKNFGLFFAFIFLLFSVYFWYKNYPWLSIFLLGSAFVMMIIATTKPNILLPLNKLWMRFGLMLGMIVNPIVVGFIFFTIFTPVAIVMRIFGRDELNIKIKNKNTYWVKRDTSLRSNFYNNQF